MCVCVCVECECVACLVELAERPRLSGTYEMKTWHDIGFPLGADLDTSWRLFWRSRASRAARVGARRGRWHCAFASQPAEHEERETARDEDHGEGLQAAPGTFGGLLRVQGPHRLHAQHTCDVLSPSTHTHKSRREKVTSIIKDPGALGRPSRPQARRTRHGICGCALAIDSRMIPAARSRDFERRGRGLRSNFRTTPFSRASLSLSLLRPRLEKSARLIGFRLQSERGALLRYFMLSKTMHTSIPPLDAAS